ncbi:TlpA disulfide reductase family protein [Sphingobacterium thalpophilum]|uniref:TlpA disulfide reductase family protein n=1 Tax=Sphingobacterium thalpophilum TaxID=259 RepID=A0ACD5C0H1_9SPHI
MRKKIRQGKTYFKGTSIRLKQRCKISDQNLIEISLEAEPKASRTGSEVSPSRDFILTNFALASAFHAIGIKFSSGSHRATAIKTRCRPDENPMKCKNSAGIAQKMVDYSLAQETHRLDYSATLGSPLLSPCYTQGQLNDCTRPTQQKQAFQQVGNARLTYEVESERSVLRLFKSICKVFVFRPNILLVTSKMVAQRALKCFLSVSDYKRAYRIILTCLFLCLVSMFSLSAQTPRKNSGADGLSEIQALGIGDTIPQSLWNLQMPVYNDSKGRSTISLSDYQDNKLIIVDFWATWCTNCIESFPKLDQLKATFKSDFDVLLVNCKRTRDDQARIDRVLKKYKDNYQLNVQFPYIIGDTIFNALFPHRGIPHVVWIGNDRVVKAITYTTELQEDNVRQILDGKKANFYIKDDFKYKVQDSLSTDTLKLFSSYLSKRREGIREMGVQIKEKGDEKEFTFLNSSVTMRIYEYLSETGHRIERNLWVFDTNVANEIRRTLKTPQRYTDEYCYFLRYPKDRIDFDPYRKMIHDIQDNFGVRWKIRKEVIDVWRIDSTPKVRKFKTKGHIPLEAIDASNNKKFIQNVPLRNSLHVLSWLLNKPVLLGDIDDINVDFDLPADLLTYTDTQLIQLLERLGAKITVAPQEVEYVYFSADRGI